MQHTEGFIDNPIYRHKYKVAKSCVYVLSIHPSGYLPKGIIREEQNNRISSKGLQ